MWEEEGEDGRKIWTKPKRNKKTRLEDVSVFTLAVSLVILSVVMCTHSRAGSRSTGDTKRRGGGGGGGEEGSEEGERDRE